MNIVQIEEVVKNLISNTESGDLPQPDFIYEFLLAYGHRKQSVTRLKTGERNLARDEADTVFWKRHLYFKVDKSAELHGVIDAMRKEARTSRHKIRFVIATDFNLFLAVDTKTGDTLDIEFKDLAKKFEFFLPWAGMEKAVYQGENPADVKAAEKLAKLFDEIKADNFDSTAASDPAKLHELNVFLSRLLFCFFAEDTNIFSDNQFSDAIASHTNDDGSDLADYLERLFTVLNQAESERPGLPDYLSSFPYVNGGLFKNDIQIPSFSRKSRKILIECGAELDWSDINPDIFGSMFQAVVHTEQRSDMGQHYTSVPNIMKVIEPLFLNDLYEELDKHQNNQKKLLELQQRIGKIKIFDPACGSGNFLIIAYKELRKLEMEILKRLQELGFEKSGQMFKPFSVIQLSQFYGIEIDDFAHEVAILSLWLTEHQMNVAFKDEFGESLPSLPLKNGGNIVCGNATRIDWEQICIRDTEVFVLGNPPYHGKKEQTSEQKNDLAFVCSNLSSFKNLDFISCWFIKASEYIEDKSCIKAAFVSTNSITQGEQVGLLWPSIFHRNIEISFAHTSFMWKNNAKKNAGVAVVIIGLQVASNERNNKSIYISSKQGITKKITDKINPYLVAGNDVIAVKRNKPISSLPEMVNGSMANDNGHFFLTESEYHALNKNIQPFYKKAVGAREFFHGINRYCLWIDDDNFDSALEYQYVKNVVDSVKNYRLDSPRTATKKLAKVAHRFGEVRYRKGTALVVPGLLAESRLGKYYPIGYFDDSTIVTNLAQVVYGAEPWLFSLLSSHMNFIWVRATSGYFKKDLRYSPVLSYNNFPLTYLNDQQKEELNVSAFKILEVREKYSNKKIFDLYNPEEMPEDLRLAHEQNDKLVEGFFRKKAFESDEERLEYLFNLYEKMIEEEKNA